MLSDKPYIGFVELGAVVNAMRDKYVRTNETHFRMLDDEEIASHFVQTLPINVKKNLSFNKFLESKKTEDGDIEWAFKAGHLEFTSAENSCKGMYIINIFETMMPAVEIYYNLNFNSDSDFFEYMLPSLYKNYEHEDVKKEHKFATDDDIKKMYLNSVIGYVRYNAILKIVKKINQYDGCDVCLDFVKELNDSVQIKCVDMFDFDSESERINCYKGLPDALPKRYGAPYIFLDFTCWLQQNELKKSTNRHEDIIMAAMEFIQAQISNNHSSSMNSTSLANGLRTGSIGVTGSGNGIVQPMDDTADCVVSDTD